MAVFELPIYKVPGVALLRTSLASIAGNFFYSVLPAAGRISALPDWLLESLFGAGGLLVSILEQGSSNSFLVNLSAHVGIMIVALAFRYSVQFFR